MGINLAIPKLQARFRVPICQVIQIISLYKVHLIIGAVRKTIIYGRA